MDIIEQLKRDEGVRLKPYRDSVGKLTIGVGRNLDDVGLHEGEEDVLLANDVNFVTVELKADWPWMSGLNEARFGAVQNMAFNMGIAALGQFHDFLTEMQAGNWARASTAMMNSLWARQVGERAVRLSVQIQTGEWQ